MTMEPERVVSELSDLARHTLDGRASDREERELAMAVRRKLAVPRSRRAWWLVVISAPLAVAGAMALLIMRAPAPSTDVSLAFDAVGASLGPGGQFDLAADREGALRFSDGTRVRLAARARGAVTRAVLRLDDGTVEADLSDRTTAPWAVVAGPFQVTVGGARFHVAWSDAARALDVQVSAGSVHVQGSLARDGIVVRAGERLRAELNEARVVLEPIASSHAPRAPGESAPPAGRPAPVRATPRSIRATEPSVTSWSSLVARGAYADLVADADARGVDRCFARCSAADLSALADAARYVGRVGVAQRALTATRARFAESPQATTAAFLLGRLAEDERSKLDAAAGWYDRYLREAPGGAYAAEALGRKMLVMQKLDRPSSARALADEYLRRFPGGSYADGARRLLGTR